MKIILSYPTWFFLFCIALGAIYALTLYYQSSHFNNEQQNISWYKKVLSLLRFVAVSMLSFLLLSPFIKSRYIDKIDPVIVFVHDNSESILLGLSSEDSAAYLSKTNQMLSTLGEQYQIDYFTFDEGIKENDTLNFTGKSSNLSHALNQINGLYFNQNVGAVIFATDGIYNQGSNPSYNDFNFPLYTIALGDTNQQTDVKVVAVRHNKLAYLDDDIQIDIDLQANHLKGKNYQLLLEKNGRTLGRKTLMIKNDFDEQSTNFTVQASTIGIHKYSVRLESLEGEISELNNYFNFYIEVIDNRQQILLVASGPHPDIAAIKSVVEVNKNFELDVQYVNKFQADIDAYSLVIIHQLPAQKQGAKTVFSAVKNIKIPVWHITGNSSAYNLLNQEQSLIQIDKNRENTNESVPYFNNSFNNFTLSESTINQLRKFPPLICPFGSYELGTNTTAVLKQKIGSVKTDLPMLAFQDYFGTRSAIFIGEGLWRWKLHDYLENGSNEAFNEIIEKTINYLALKGDQRKFRVNTSKTSFFEGETILVEAELYNENYELINGPEANLLIKNEDKNEFPFVFNKTSKAYQYETNSLPIGNYTYTANTSFNGKALEAYGAFSIKAMQLEALQTKANHHLLRKLSEQTNGVFFDVNQLDELSNQIDTMSTIKPVLYESFKTRPIINLFGLFFIIISLLGVEWFARKWLGAY